jgi:glutamyl-tRNA synthetase
MVRTALFNWAYARHTGGTFVFRIEDTDSARDSEQSYNDLLDSLRWLGMDWDEGPEVGGPHGPYRQSQRMDIYADAAGKLLASGHAYHCYCSQEELEERREAAREAGKTPGYDGACRKLSAEQKSEYETQGRLPVVRFRMPDTDFTWNDLVRGDVTFAAEHVPDYVIVRATGEPLYTLVNPLDDVLMEITHVLRGEDLLSSTPRQLALYDALKEIGIAKGERPLYGHLPYVMGEGNKKLSKRDPESSLLMYREEGYLPEGLLNYLALLGWAFGEDREFFSKEEMATVFDVARVNANPARFDLKKCTSINGDWIRTLAPDELARRITPYLIKDGVLSAEPTSDQMEVLRNAIPLVQERMETLRQGLGMLGFLFADQPGSPAFIVDPVEAEKVLTPEAQPVLVAALAALTAVADWTTPAIEEALRTALIEGLELKPKVAFGPVRVAVTGRRVSPPLFESLEILGRERSLARITASIK